MFRRFEQGVVAVLAVTIVVNLLLMVEARSRPSRATGEPVPLYRSLTAGDAAPRFEGFTAGDHMLRVMPSQPERGWAIRYISSKCGYCEADTHGKRLAVELERSGRSVITLVPRAGEEVVVTDAVVRPESAQVAFVPMEWAKRFRLTGTPTFLIFGSTGRLIWHHEGTLAPADVEAALRVTKEAGERGQPTR